MASFLRTLRTRWRGECGAEFVEFALAFPLLMLVVMGIIEFGTMFQQYEVITNAAREGARIAVLPNYNASVDAPARVSQYVQAGGLNPGLVSTSVTGPTNVSIGSNCMQTYEIRVWYPHPYFYLVGIGQYFGASFGSKMLSARSTMRTEVISGACP